MKARFLKCTALIGLTVYALFQVSPESWAKGDYFSVIWVCIVCSCGLFLWVLEEMRDYVRMNHPMVWIRRNVAECYAICSALGIPEEVILDWFPTLKADMEMVNKERTKNQNFSVD